MLFRSARNGAATPTICATPLLRPPRAGPCAGGSATTTRPEAHVLQERAVSGRTTAGTANARAACAAAALATGNGVTTALHDTAAATMRMTMTTAVLGEATRDAPAPGAMTTLRRVVIIASTNARRGAARPAVGMGAVITRSPPLHRQQCACQRLACHRSSLARCRSLRPCPCTCLRLQPSTRS